MTWVEGVMPQVHDPALVLNWAKLLVQKGRLSQAEQVLLERTRQAGDDPAPWLLLGAIRQESKNTSGATEAWLRFLKESASNPKLTRERDQALLGLAQLGIEAKREAEAEKWLTQVTDPDNLLRARLMRATILGRKGQIEQGRTLIATLPAQTQKQEIARTMTEVQYLRQFKQWQATYDLLAQTARQFDDEDEIAYELALAAEKVGKVDEMEAILRDIIEANPKFHQAHNALGYSLAERNIRLDEAKKLILQAVAMAPDDPFIADSLGWVEFRLGNKEEARKILQKAFDTRQDAEIAAHLGEVLWSLGLKDRALDVWRSGLRQDADNETLLEALKRLDVRP
jgi:tetratricopeptide (TPR) repeat protein